jgi:predicted RNA-binding Zn ribbon-like protein
LETRWTCLEFVRTVGWAERDRPDDEFTCYEALVGWAERAGIVDPAVGRRLLGRAATVPQEGARVLEEAIALRETLYRIFAAVGQGQEPEESDIETLNAALPAANRWLGIVPSSGGFEWDWLEGPEPPLDRILWPVVRSAADLLTSDELRRLKLCRAHDCGWLFVDGSRNRSRRWCDMSDCGNRAKARRFRERRKPEA